MPASQPSNLSAALAAFDPSSLGLGLGGRSGGDTDAERGSGAGASWGADGDVEGASGVWGRADGDEERAGGGGGEEGLQPLAGDEAAEEEVEGVGFAGGQEGRGAEIAGDEWR
ncbi:hypothetical protein JCM10449v2_007651 [Rhodotorula kratochvilovae]